MPSSTITKHAVGAIRVSSKKQGINGDSPEDQKNQIDQYAAARGIKITKYFLFLESASKALQPMQEVIDYCKEASNDVQQVIVKSIDRFTRGGSEFYSELKNQLDDCNVALVDTYGFISSEKINTLEHLNVSYKWSVYSPTKKAEILEAERAKDEVRDIQTRMIGAQIRYARMGYWIRRPIYGYDNIHIETRDGKRCVLERNPDEAYFIEKLFDLRAKGTVEDIEIVNTLNSLGFKTRTRVVRDKNDRTKITNVIGGEQLTLKTMSGMISNPVYAGVNSEQWTQDTPVKCKFDGLVSIDLWNAANKGRVIILEDDNSIKIVRREVPQYLLKKGVRNEDFPFKRIVLCPGCNKPLYGSASRGRHGGYFPAYHCARKGHYFRKTKQDFDKTISDFVISLQIEPEYIDALMDRVTKEFDEQLVVKHRDAVAIDLRVNELKHLIQQSIDKIKYLSSETAIKYMEEDIEKLNAEITNLHIERQKTEAQKPVDMDKIKTYVRYYLEHIEKILLNRGDPMQQAKFFGLIFDKAPTYEDIEFGTPNYECLTGVSKLFRSKKGFDKTHGWG